MRTAVDFDDVATVVTDLLTDVGDRAREALKEALYEAMEHVLNQVPANEDLADENDYPEPDDDEENDDEAGRVGLRRSDFIAGCEAVFAAVQAAVEDAKNI